jgi:transcriptional regulator GlxA family with amidase domain
MWMWAETTEGAVSASHFSKCFREVYGQSPAETRLTRDRSSLCV